MATKSVHALQGRTITCVLFDLGDTLWYRKDMDVWYQLENAANLRAVALLRTYFASSQFPALEDQELGRRLRSAFDARSRGKIRQEPGVEPDCPLTMQEAAADLGLRTLERAAAAKVFEALRVRIPESRPLFDDTLSTLEELRRRGFLLGVVTNRLWGGQPFQEDLQTLGLLEYFDPATIATSADLTVRKPNPAIFKHSLRALGVAPQEAMMVGDSLRSDIVGAQSLNIFAVWKPKPRIRAELRARLVAPGVAAGEASESAASQYGADQDNLSPGMHITDDDYILAYAQQPSGQAGRPSEVPADPPIQPDLIIEQLADLLEVLSKPGE